MIRKDGGDRSNTPPETQTATRSNTPMTTTVTGCLAAGDAADTYVLNAARADGATATASPQGQKCQ
jgi:thioredoxin reductase